MVYSGLYVLRDKRGIFVGEAVPYDVYVGLGCAWFYKLLMMMSTSWTRRHHRGVTVHQVVHERRCGGGACGSPYCERGICEKRDSSLTDTGKVWSFSGAISKSPVCLPARLEGEAFRGITGPRPTGSSKSIYFFTTFACL